MKPLHDSSEIPAPETPSAVHSVFRVPWLVGRISKISKQGIKETSAIYVRWQRFALNGIVLCIAALPTQASAPRLRPINQIGHMAYAWNRWWNIQGSVDRILVDSQQPTVIRFVGRGGERRSRDSAARDRVELSAGLEPMQYGMPYTIYFSRRVWKPKEGSTGLNVVATQVHNSNEPDDTGVARPILAFRVVGDESVITVSGSLENPLKTDSTVVELFRGPLSWDRWSTFRIIANFRPSDGTLQIWQDNKKIVDKTGLSIGFVDSKGPYFKFGVYRATDNRDMTIDYRDVNIKNNESIKRI